MPLASAIVTELQGRFPDLTTTDALLYINNVHKIFCAQVPDIIQVAQTVVTSDNVGTYDLDGGTINIIRVLYTSGATTTPLNYTTRDQLFTATPLWPQTPKGTPTMFYVADEVTANISQLKITIYPKPTGVGSLAVYSSIQQTLLATDLLPEGLATYDMYLEGASYYTAASLRSQQEAMQYFPIWQQWTELNKAAWKTMQPQVALDATFPYKPK